MTRRQQNIGKHGETLAANTLSSLGVEMVEKIATPVVFHREASGKCVIDAWGEKVSGDHRGILPGGRSVLIETKTILDRNLRYSDLREHQPDRLSRHAELGGLSLLVWVHDSGVYVFEWPVSGFGPGQSLTVEHAQSWGVPAALEYGIVPEDELDALTKKLIAEDETEVAL